MIRVLGHLGKKVGKMTQGKVLKSHPEENVGKE